MKTTNDKRGSYINHYAGYVQRHSCKGGKAEADDDGQTIRTWHIRRIAELVFEFLDACDVGFRGVGEVLDEILAEQFRGGKARDQLLHRFGGAFHLRWVV